MMRFFYKDLSVPTDQNNLLELEPKLAPYLDDHDIFFIRDLTDDAGTWVTESGIVNGVLTIQVLHTTCLMSINELDEPCLLGDLAKKLREFAPRQEAYLHNSSVRTKNLCENDIKCDRNADAHIKATLLGSPTQQVLVRDGRPLFGQWQRLCLIDLDGPRTRQVVVQIIGE